MNKKLTQKEWRNSVAWVGVVAGCLVRKNDKILLVQEKQEKVYGLWNLPAGHVDRGETIEQAAVREVHEETGYEVKLGEQIGIFHEAINKPVIHIFDSEILTGDLKIQENEILDAKWLSKKEIESLRDDDKLRANWIWGVVSSCS